MAEEEAEADTDATATGEVEEEVIAGTTTEGEATGGAAGTTGGIEGRVSCLSENHYHI